MLASVFSCALISLDGAVVQVQVDPNTKSLHCYVSDLCVLVSLR
jgi:hypothetical protein